MHTYSYIEDDMALEKIQFLASFFNKKCTSILQAFGAIKTKAYLETTSPVAPDLESIGRMQKNL